MSQYVYDEKTITKTLSKALAQNWSVRYLNELIHLWLEDNKQQTAAKEDGE